MHEKSEVTLEIQQAPPAGRYARIRPLMAPMLVAFAIRMIVVVFYYRQLPDADKYYEQFGWEVGWVARSLASGHGFSSPFWPPSGPTDFVPPLYPFLLSCIFKVFGIYTLTSGFIILTLNSLFSTLTCMAVYYSAEHSLGLRGAKIAAWVWALYPFAIYFSADRVWEYSLTSLLFTTCFCIAQRLHRVEGWTVWVGFGILFGLAAHSNPAVLSCFPFLLLLALWERWRSGLSWVTKGLVAVLVLAAVLAPWTVRNLRVLGVSSPMRDNFWLEFYAGNCVASAPAERPSRPEPHPASNPEEMKRFLAMGEVRYLAEKRAMAMNFVESNPSKVAGAVLRRVVYYWAGYWSFNKAYLAIEPTEIPMMFYVCAVTVLMGIGSIRLWRRDRAVLMPYMVLIGVLPLAYYLTISLMDYRQPIEPAVVVLAVAGAVPLRRAREENWPGSEHAAEMEEITVSI